MNLSRRESPSLVKQRILEKEKSISENQSNYNNLNNSSSKLNNYKLNNSSSNSNDFNSSSNQYSSNSSSNQYSANSSSNQYSSNLPSNQYSSNLSSNNYNYIPIYSKSYTNSNSLLDQTEKDIKLIQKNSSEEINQFLNWPKNIQSDR